MKIFAQNHVFYSLFLYSAPKQLLIVFIIRFSSPQHFINSKPEEEWCWWAVRGWHRDRKKSDWLAREHGENLKHRTVGLSGIIFLMHQQILMSQSYQLTSYWRVWSSYWWPWLIKEIIVSSLYHLFNEIEYMIYLFSYIINLKNKKTSLLT